MRVRIFKSKFTNVQAFATYVRYDLFLDNYQVSCCTMDGHWDDKEMIWEQDKRAVEKLINDLQRHIRQYINEPHNAINCENFKDKILDVNISEKDIKDWMLKYKMKRIEQDFI